MLPAKVDALYLDDIVEWVNLSWLIQVGYDLWHMATGGRLGYL